jgi:hypothetical protein
MDEFFYIFNFLAQCSDFKKNIAWILLQICKISKNFGLHFKNIKHIYFISFNMRDYKLIHKMYS